MPHIIIDHSDNINFGDNWHDIAASCHDLLVEIMPTSAASCRTRIVPHALYHVGDRADQDKKGFVSVTIKALSGRSQDTLTKAGTEIFKLISNHVQKNHPNLHIEFSVEMADLAPVYIKAV